MATIKAGTYKFNEVITFPDNVSSTPYWEFNFALPEITVEGEIYSVTCAGMLFMNQNDTNILQYGVSDGGGSLPVYIPEDGGYWNTAHAVDTNFPEGYGQIITITEDFTSADEYDEIFVTWFNANTKPYTETTSAAEITYKGETISLEEGDSVALHTSGKIMRDDIVVNISVSKEYDGETTITGEPIEGGDGADPILQEKTITENGEYLASDDNADGYSKITVNVQPTLQEKTATANGEVIPDEGYDGLSKVTVNVPEANLQEKTVTPSSNEQNVTPDEGYDGLSKVIVESIPDGYIVPSGDLSITENGTFDVTEKESVTVNITATDVPEWDRSYTITGGDA